MLVWNVTGWLSCQSTAASHSYLLGRKELAAEVGDVRSEEMEECEISGGGFERVEWRDGRCDECGGGRCVWIGNWVGNDGCGEASVGDVRVGGGGGCAGKADGRLLLVDVVVEAPPGDIEDIEDDIGDEVYGCSIGV